MNKPKYINKIFASTEMLIHLDDFRRRSGLPVKFIGNAMIEEYLIKHDPVYRSKRSVPGIVDNISKLADQFDDAVALSRDIARGKK